MKCFNHPEKDAVAICKSCHKALCSDCAVEVTNGIACKGKCEEEVKFLNEMVQKNKNIDKKASQSLYITAFIYIALGLAAAGFGFFTELWEVRPFALILGAIMILAGVVTIVFGRKFKK